MAGRIKVTRQKIIQCALEITRKEGIEACNARRIGKELNCSLQPVYYYFGTMDILRQEVMKAANQVYNECLRSIPEVEKRFKAVGLNYIRFATEEKELFKFLFMQSAHHVSSFVVEVDDNTEQIIDEIMQEYHLTKEEAKKLHFETWVATHGIASMITTGFMIFPPEQINEMLEDYCIGLLMKMKGAKKND